ncbi:2-oxo acid dehydrogenase subunit E2 [Candidatus Micrarchaeota archaeon]|nr:2-oxo acid dehydrogenase subunit E2 [Candidatus Micrarchaeota archaeon]
MAKHMLFPDVGEGIREGTLVKWLVKEGDPVKEDQPIAEVETDKAVVEIPSRDHGTVLKLYGKPGDVILVGKPLMTVGEPGEPMPDAEEAITESNEKKVEVPKKEASAAPERILAPPSVRAAARKAGIDLSKVSGSGPGGRITAEDLEKAKGGALAAPASTHQEKTLSFDYGKGKRVPLTHLRKTISERMSWSWRHVAHVTYIEEVDFGALKELRGRNKPKAEQMGFKLTPLAYMVKAVATTLKQYPRFNASLDEEKAELILHDEINVAVGVDTEEGLIAPVLKNADQKSVFDIAKEIGGLSEKARARKLSLDELRASTFTVTNIGSVGGVLATAVLNPPESAILGVNRMKDRPVVRDGKIVIRPMTYLGLTFDHRVGDGADAARFMKDLVEKLENPAWMEKG